MAQHFTPWQRMRAYETQVRKIEDYWFLKARQKKCQDEQEGSNVVVMEPLEPCCTQPMTYYNNGKCNNCCKDRYAYNFFYTEGYDQYRHREDRKHPHIYMNLDYEEEYPCRTVPLLTNSNYGHRPPIDTMLPIPKKHATGTFYRSRGTAHCLDANGYHSVKLLPTFPFKWNAQYGYTYSPPRN